MTISELLSRFSIPADRKGRTNLILEIFLTGFAATLFLPLGEIRGTCMWGGFLVWLLVAEKNYLGKLARDRSFLLLLGLIGYALLSATWSPDPKGSFKSWKTTFDDYLCVIPVLVHFAYQPDFRARLMRIFSMAGLFSVFADCAQYAYEFASGAYREIDMRMAHYRRPLPLVLYAPFLLARAHETSGRQRVLWGASFVIAGLLLLPTGARGAWLAFATATSLYFAFFLSFRQLLLIPVACVRHFQHQFVVHLHDEARFQQLPAFEPVLHGDHRQLDQVGGGALHRRVDRGAFGALAAAAVAGADLRQPQAAAEHGFDIAGLPGHFACFFHVAGDAGIAGEVAVDVVCAALRSRPSWRARPKALMP
jgi:hypothetical protein